MHELNIQDKSNLPGKILFPMVLLGIILLASGCLSNKGLTTDQANELSSPFDSLSFQYNKEISNGATLQVTMVNNSEQAITLLQPYDIHIYHLADDSTRIRTLYCPCNASCTAPSEQLDIPSGKRYNLKWTAVERWCEMDDENARLRIERRADLAPGKYMLVLNLKAGEQIKKKKLSFFIK